MIVDVAYPIGPVVIGPQVAGIERTRAEGKSEQLQNARRVIPTRSVSGVFGCDPFRHPRFGWRQPCIRVGHIGTENVDSGCPRSETVIGEVVHGEALVDSVDVGGCGPQPEDEPSEAVLVD